MLYKKKASRHLFSRTSLASLSIACMTAAISFLCFLASDSSAAIAAGIAAKIQDQALYLTAGAELSVRIPHGGPKSIAHAR